MNGRGMDELSAIVAEPVRVEIGGRTVDIRPLIVRQLPPFTRAIRPIGEAIYLLLEQDEQHMDGWLALIEDHGERLIDAAEIAVPALSRDQIECLPLDDFAALLMGVLEANVDFFARRLLPGLEARMGATAGRMEGRIGGISGNA